MDKVNTALMHLNEAVDSKCKTKYKTIQEKVQQHSRAIHENVLIARPWSYEDFIERSLTFSKTMTWFAKPSLINPLICSLHGWTNSSVDTLSCHHCSKSLVHDKDDLKGDHLYARLKSNHETFCPWFTNTCPIQFLTFPEYSHDQIINDFITRFLFILDGIEQALSSRMNGKELILVLPTTILSYLTDLTSIISSTDDDDDNNNNRKNMIPKKSSSSSSSLPTTATTTTTRSIHCLGSMVQKQPISSIIQSKKLQLEPLLMTSMNNGSLPAVSKYACAIHELITNEKFNNNNNNNSNSNNNNNGEMTSDMKQHINNLILICLILSLSGWSPTQSTATTGGGGTRLGCNLCGRTVDLNYFCNSNSNSLLSRSHHRRLSGRVLIHDDDDVNAPHVFDPLAQHRSYCPWLCVTTINSTSINSSSSSNSITSSSNSGNSSSNSSSGCNNNNSNTSSGSDILEVHSNLSPSNAGASNRISDDSTSASAITPPPLLPAPAAVVVDMSINSPKNQMIEKRCGWEIIADELFFTSKQQQQQQEGIFSNKPLSDKRNHVQLLLHNHTSSSSSSSSSSSVTFPTETSPENAYKRIKSILNMAVQPYQEQRKRESYE